MRLDLLIDETGDLEIFAGDFAIGPSDQQHVLDIIDVHPGEIKEFPLIGFGAINYIKRVITPEEFKRDLKLQLNYDGYENATINTSKGIENLNIDI